MNQPAPARLGARLALQLWIASIACWWVIGVEFSRLWWLVNQSQQRWILFCYLWEVPAIGWTGAVLFPYLGFRRLERRLREGRPGTFAALARYPGRVAQLVLATSTLGYFLSAVQVDHFASLPALEFAKITIQGPVLGGLFALAAYLMTERAVRQLGAGLEGRVEPVIGQSLYAKVFSITAALTLGVSVPIFLFGLSVAQRDREELRAQALIRALDEASTQYGLEGSLGQFGPHTYAFVARRSNSFIVWGRGQGTVLLGDGRADFGVVQTRTQGWFASRDGEHKVVAFQLRPGFLPDGDAAVFVAVSPLADYGGELLAATRTAGVVALCALLIGLGLAAMLARNIVSPIERLRAAATQMAAGDLDVPPMSITGGDEIAALAHAFDRMAVRVRGDEANLRKAFDQLQLTQAQLLAHERLSAIGRVVSGVAHELNNPLAAVLYLSEDLRDDGSRSQGEREVLQVIADQARRCRVIVRDLLSFARGREQRFEAADGSALLANAAAAAEPVLRETGARLQLRAPNDLPELEVDRSGIEQVLTNLIVNGAQAAGPGGTVTVEATEEAGGWRLTVEDTGPGIPAAVLPRIFEPFFTTKPQGEGTGLGLAVSLGIVERHGGALLVEPGGDGRGARFVVRIPGAVPSELAAGPSPDGARAAELPAGPGGKGGPPRKPRVLVVDDEGSLRLALGRFFRRQGWEVEEAEDGAVALELLAAAPAEAYGVVISDLRMPRRSGLEVHDWLAAHRPDLFSRLIIITGDLASPQVREFVGRTSRPVIEKPFELSALAEAVRNVKT